MTTELAATVPRSGVTPRLLVVGCGNLLAGDDGAGVEVVERLIEAGVEGCQLCLMPSGGVDLLAMFPAADVILFVDAVTSGAPAGTLHLVPLSRDCGVEPRGMGSLSTHGLGLLETFELARALGRHVPRVVLLGVEIGEVTWGTPRSPAVERALATIVEGFSRLHVLLVDGDSSLCRSARQFPPDDASFPGE